MAEPSATAAAANAGGAVGSANLQNKASESSQQRHFRKNSVVKCCKQSCKEEENASISGHGRPSQCCSGKNRRPFEQIQNLRSHDDAHVNANSCCTAEFQQSLKIECA